MRTWLSEYIHVRMCVYIWTIHWIGLYQLLLSDNIVVPQGKISNIKPINNGETRAFLSPVSWLFPTTLPSGQLPLAWRRHLHAQVATPARAGGLTDYGLTRGEGLDACWPSPAGLLESFGSSLPNYQASLCTVEEYVFEIRIETGQQVQKILKAWKRKL